MAYFLSGVGVEVSPQAVRPREPKRPSVSTVTRSQEMANRALRPREGTAVVPGTSKSNTITSRLKAVTVAKQAEAKAVVVLKVKGQDLALAKNVLNQANLSGSLPATAAAQARVAQVGREIDACINCIKQSAAQANAAAGGAINAGASREDVKEAAAVGSASVPTQPIAPSGPTEVAQQQAFAASSPIGPPVAPPVVAVVVAAASPTAAIESSSASISPSGVITPGPGAQIVDSPSQADPSVSKQDVVVSSGSLGTLALVAAAAGIGYLMLKKKGRV